MANQTIAELREKHEFKLLLVAVVVFFTVGTIFYHFAEQWSWVDSLYFCVVAAATVGFGDFTPTHTASKIFTIIFILTGLSVIMAFVNFVVKRREKIRAEKIKEKIPENN